MLDYRLVLTGVAIACGFAGYAFYFRNIMAGKTKPHAFSWFVWGFIASIAFAAQIFGKGGHGALVMGFTAVSCFIITILALLKGKRDFPLFDWLCLFASFVAVGLWIYTKNPLASILIITVTDAIAFLPTFRKAYFKPREETAITFVLSGVKFFLSLFALDRFTVITALYPSALVALNAVFVTMVLIRRNILRHQHNFPKRLP